MGFLVLGRIAGCRERLLDQDFQIGRQRLCEFMDHAILHQRNGDPGRTKLGGSDSGPEENDCPRAIILSAGPDQSLRLWVWVARISGALPALIFGDFNRS
jgi:hypothetical protein